MAAPYFIVPFATGGDQLPDGVPVTLQPDGSISYTLGWGPDYELEDTQPGYKPVGRREMNSMFNAVTWAVGEIQQHGFPLWRVAAAPYPINAVVRDGATNWRSTVENNNTVPGAEGANWVSLSAVVQATETIVGGVQIATQPEVTAGVSDTDAVTPLKLKTWFANVVRSATESVTGFIRIATQALVDAGTNDTDAITPLKLAQNKANETVVSSWTNISLGGLITVNHTWGVLPQLATLEMKCIVANNGFTVGQEFPVSMHGSADGGSSSTSSPTGVYWTTTQVTARMGLATPLLITNPATGQQITAGAANFQMRLRVRK